jgi:predicted nucleic acid-binding protein
LAVRVLADTNWLVAAYFRRKDANRSIAVERFAKRHDVPWMISPVVLMECENTFKRLAEDAHPSEWGDLKADIGTRIFITNDNWDEISVKAKELVQRFSHRESLGTLDLMILASALKAEATHLLSFDTGSNLRALAAVLKLKVVPELTAKDKTRMAAFH